MLYNRKIDRLLVLVVPIALFIYASTRPHMRLRADMPPEFAETASSMSPKRRADEEKLASEYWECALTSIQWKYTYGSPLPDSPPAEFRVVANTTTDTETRGASARSRYWRRLQKVWLLPSSWVSSHEWSTSWLTDAIKNVFSWVNNYFTNHFATS
jgi:hypothetical protein